jgi:hypothetical protein
MRALALLTLVVCPLSTLAEEEAAPPRWSLGAGVTAVIYSSCSGADGLVCPTSESPGATASLERRLSDRRWLVVSVDGTVREGHQDRVPGGAGGYRTSFRQANLGVGLRQVLTGRGARVDVSLLALAQGGYDQTESRFEGSPAQRSSAWLCGASVGLALDRELTSGLSVRVATPLAGAWWQQSRQRVSGTTSRGHAFTASLYLAPRLELRLAF